MYSPTPIFWEPLSVNYSSSYIGAAILACTAESCKIRSERGVFGPNFAVFGRTGPNRRTDVTFQAGFCSFRPYRSKSLHRCNSTYNGPIEVPKISVWGYTQKTLIKWLHTPQSCKMVEQWSSVFPTALSIFHSRFLQQKHAASSCNAHPSTRQASVPLSFHAGVLSECPHLPPSPTIITHIVECPCGLVVKWKCISLYQLQYCNTSCVLDCKPLLYKERVDDTIAVVVCCCCLSHIN